MTTEPTIPTATVEKAARGIYTSERTSAQWVNISEGDREYFAGMAHAALAPVYADIQAEARAATLDQLLRAAYVVDSRHHLHGTACSCGFEGSARKRTQTEHITTAVVTEYRAALFARVDELDGGQP